MGLFTSKIDQTFQYRMRQLSQQKTILPLEILTLAHDIAAIDSARKTRRLIEYALNSEQATLSRIALTTIRFLGAQYISHYTNQVLDKTQHIDPWVRYDAVWVLGELSCQDPIVKQRLYTMAGHLALCPLPELKQIQAKTAEEHTRIKAAKSYRKYLQQQACTT